MNDAVLRLDAVEKTYNPGQPNAVHILHGVDFELAKGEVVAMVAPSGAGKSTLLHIAGLLDTPSAGRVEIAGQDLTDASDDKRTIARRQSVGFVYQFHYLLPEFTAIENVIFPQLTNGRTPADAENRATDVLTRLGLADRLHHRPAMMSGGEQQRVAIARSLANDPAVLLADEPTGNLDPDTSARVFDMLLERVRDMGLSALIATHNHELARKMDRAVKLDRGIIVDAGLT